MNLEFTELLRRAKRLLDGHFSYRRLFTILIAAAILVLYVGPYVLRWFVSTPTYVKDYETRCLDDRLAGYSYQNNEYNLYIKHAITNVGEKDYLPYVGNGYFGIPIEKDAQIYIKSGRSLTLPVKFQPLISIISQTPSTEAIVVEYLTGIVHKFECFRDGYYVRHQFYAHRTMPSVFVQEFRFTNPTNQQFDIELSIPHITNWPGVSTPIRKLQHGSSILEYHVISGPIDVDNNMIVAVSIVMRKPPRQVVMHKRNTVNLVVLLTIEYSEPISRDDYNRNKELVERKAIESMKHALQEAQHEGHGISTDFRNKHESVWRQMWSTGFTISDSKAQDSLNGDKINATMYYVLSQVRSFELEERITQIKKTDITKSLTYTEGCYEGFHTLQADNLWKDLDTLDSINAVVTTWLLTLEKQGCHNLIKAGASGVVQAMVLSFGGLRFSNQHLEFNIHPKYLHRDFQFRRINYGNMTHVNITVIVREDNKAVLYVALDRSDRNYYACDGGCLDNPVQLGPIKREFPIKLTSPLTAILYITSDKQHMEDLRHAIHVKEVIEAPAHEHHIIALHRHGHHLGGLPTLFWVSICLLIIIFHVFLCKLVMNEYCEQPDKYRNRYSKP